MQKKTSPAGAKSNLAQNKDLRRNSCPGAKPGFKKSDYLSYFKSGSAHISKITPVLSKDKPSYYAISQNSLPEQEFETLHTEIPTPELQPTLEKQINYDIPEEDQQYEEVHMEDDDDEEGQDEQEREGDNRSDGSENRIEEYDQQPSVDSVDQNSKLLSDAAKEDENLHSKDYGDTISPSTHSQNKIEHEDLSRDGSKSSQDDLPGPLTESPNIIKKVMKEDNKEHITPHSSQSTVLIEESSKINNFSERDIKYSKATQEIADARDSEIRDSEMKHANYITIDAAKAIENVVEHDGPLIQPKPQEVSEANIAAMRNKINLEVYLKVENLIYSIKENIMSGQPVYQLCKDYIEIAPKIDRECFEKILKIDAEKKLIKSSFILKRLGVIMMLYFTVENTPNDKAVFQLKNLINIIHQNYLLFGYLIIQKLKDKSKSNIWIARILELLEHDSSANFTKNENIEKLKYNNTFLCNIMKNLIITMKNKEVLYAYNSVVVQLDRISIKEAYTRLLKSFSVFMSEKELKTQVLKNVPRKSVQDSKFQKVIKGEKKKEEIAFLPKLIKAGDDHRFTLVVDLDETLVHYAEIPGKLNELRVRPYVGYFLSEVVKYYEIVVFTAAMQEYADWVLDNIDKDHHISHRLYRQHASPDGYNFVKDLSKLGRDISKMIIVDNLAENFRLQPDNGIYIKPWYDDHEDTALYELTPLLTEIAEKKVSDVRVALRMFRDQMLENIEKGNHNPHLNLTLE